MSPDFKNILLSVEKPGRYVGGEFGEVMKSPEGKVRVAFCFPDTYEVGMSNIGMKILVGIFNQFDWCWCERAFCPWPDMAQKLRESGISLGTLESGESLRNFDIVAFTLQYEMCYTNVLEMLNLAGIPFLASERGEDMPLVICGGPCAYNIEPLADVFDAVMIGEGEEMDAEFVSLYHEMKDRSKEDFLKAASSVGGVYVPRFYSFSYDEQGRIRSISHDENVPEKITKRIVADLDKAYFPTDTPVASGEIIQDRDAVELFRGCIRGCRFCQAGHTFRPIRQKSPDVLVDQSLKCLRHSGAGELALSSLSTSDYSGLSELCDKLLPQLEKEKINLSVPSLRADNFSTELTKRISGVRKSSVTFAPEAGSQRLRDVINKNLSEPEIINACRTMFENGWSRVKLYFMLGLPTETDFDIEQISELADRIVHTWRTCDRDTTVTRQLSISLSTSLFIPKPFTPFQWERMCTVEEMNQKIEVLKNKLKAKAVTYSWHDPNLSFLEGVMARGDRKLCPAIIKAWENGCRFDAWDEHFNYSAWMRAFDECGLDPMFYLRERREDELLPWSHIDCGISNDYFLKSRHDAYQEIITPDCRSAPGGCSGCGAWKLLGHKCDIGSCTANKPLPETQKESSEQKDAVSYRFVFEKTGKSIYTSHLEIMKNFSMAFKRLGIRLKYSSGFSPKPYLSIARPLSLGYESYCEILDTQIVGFDKSRDELIDRMNSALPDGLHVCKEEPEFESNEILASVYELTAPLTSSLSEEMRSEMTQFLSGDIFVAKKSKKGMRTVNIRDGIYRLDLSEEEGHLKIVVSLKDSIDGSINPRLIIAPLCEKYSFLTPSSFRVVRLRFENHR